MSCVRTVINTIEVYKTKGTPWGNFPGPKNFKESLQKWNAGVVSEDTFSQELKDAIAAFNTKVAELEAQRVSLYSNQDYVRGDVDD